MNPLTGILTPAVRRYVYAAYALVGIVLGAIQVAYGVTEPQWLTVSLAVYAFLGTALGLTAASNTPSPERTDGDA